MQPTSQPQKPSPGMQQFQDKQKAQQSIDQVFQNAIKALMELEYSGQQAVHPQVIQTIRRALENDYSKTKQSVLQQPIQAPQGGMPGQGGQMPQPGGMPPQGAAQGGGGQPQIPPQLLQALMAAKAGQQAPQSPQAQPQPGQGGQ